MGLFLNRKDIASIRTYLQDYANDKVREMVLDDAITKDGSKVLFNYAA